MFVARKARSSVTRRQENTYLDKFFLTWRATTDPDFCYHRGGASREISPIDGLMSLRIGGIVGCLGWGRITDVGENSPLYSHPGSPTLHPQHFHAVCGQEGWGMRG